MTGGAALLTVGAVLQSVPDLVESEAGLFAGIVAIVGTAVFTSAHIWLEHRAIAPAHKPEAAVRQRLAQPKKHFTGHADMMGDLVEAFDRFCPTGLRRFLRPRAWRSPVRSSREPLVLAVTGEGGTGKSELAAQVVQKVEQRFPDGLLEFALYGDDQRASSPPAPASYASSSSRAHLEPRRPEDLLAQMLSKLGVRPPRKASLDELAGLWRTATEHRRLLVVLDNAKDYAQVRPLLPSGGGCATLITSRNEMPDAGPSVQRRRLGPLSVDESHELLGRLAEEAPSRPLTDEDRTAFPGIVEACHRLPLALCLVGSQISQGSAPGAADLLRRMQDPDLRSADPSRRAIAQSVEFGLRQCEPRERLLMNRLAASRLTTFTAWSAAALLDISEEEAKPLLMEMSHRYLVTHLYVSAGLDRFQLHDQVRKTLLSDGPRMLGVPEEELPGWSEQASAEAVRRLLGAFDRIAGQAARRAAPHEWDFSGTSAGTGAGSGSGSGSGDHPSAPAPTADRLPGRPEDEATDHRVSVGGPVDPMAWLESERGGFEVCFHWTRPGAGDPGLAEHGWRLRRSFSVLSRTGRTYWRPVREATREATALALEMEEPFAYGVALLDRAEVAGGHGDHVTGYERALTALHVLERCEGADPRWIARARRAIGVNLYRRGDMDDGRSEIEEAVRIFSEHDDRWWQVRTLCNLAEVYRFQGHLERAQERLARAEELLAGTEDLPEQSEQWARLRLQKGEVLRLRGYELNAWFVLAEGWERSAGSDEGWYRARFLRALGQLASNRLNRAEAECALLHAPEWERERRRRTAREPRWPQQQRERVAKLFEDGSAGLAERCAEAGPARGLFRRRERLRRLWQVDAQVSRLREAESAFRDIGDDWGRWRTCLALGQALLQQDRRQGGEEFLRAARGFRDVGDEWWHARAHRMAAEALNRAERRAEAEELARVAIDGYRGLRHRSGQIRAMTVLASITLHSNPLEAWRTLKEAEEVALEGTRLGVVPGPLLRQVRDLLGVTETGA